MGLLTGLLTLPLAPVRGTIWIAEQIAIQAERELGDEKSLRRHLAEAEREFELGMLSPEEYESIEDALLDRLEDLREAERRERTVAGA
jgi:gas vesicle protein GvpG